MRLKQITDWPPPPPKKKKNAHKNTHIAANRASIIRQVLCRSHARFTCTLEDTSRNVQKAAEVTIVSCLFAP